MITTKDTTPTPTPTMVYKEMIERGIDHMITGQHRKANECFQMAIESIRSHLMVAEMQQEEPVPTAIVTLHAVKFPTCLSETALISPSGTFELYTKAFRLEITTTTTTTTTDYSLILAAVFFNLALNMHIMSLKDVSREKSANARARRFYQLSKEFVLASSFSEQQPFATTRLLEQSNVASFYLLLLAQHNNEGHACATVFDHVGAQACADQAEYCLRRARPLLHQSSGNVREDCKFFELSSTLCEIMKSGGHAAPLA